MATSKLHQFLDDVDDKILECTICLKRLQNPKSLPCLHSFCLLCLEDWVVTKGALTCPTCCRFFPFPADGIENLQPNTLLNNLIEIIEQFSEKDQKECVCGKEGKAEHYCQECRDYLCSSCGDCHKTIKLFETHKLHSMEDMQSMSTIKLASLHPPLCFIHRKPVECYCMDCKQTVCVNCTVLNHKEHKKVSISEAFKTFKKTAEILKLDAYNLITKLQDRVNALSHSCSKLEQNKDMALRSIDSYQLKLFKKIEKNFSQTKEVVDQNCNRKKAATNVQIRKLNTTMSDISMKLSLLNHVLKNDDAIAMQSADMVTSALKDLIQELPEIQLDDSEKVYFFKNELQETSLQQAGIGYVSTKRAADCLILEGNKYVAQGQTTVIKIIKENDCKVDVNQLQATWTQPTGEAYIAQIKEDERNGNYIVTGKCSSSGICRLDVKLITDNKPIKNSPMEIMFMRKKFNLELNNTVCVSFLVSILAVLVILMSGHFSTHEDTTIKTIGNEHINTIKITTCGPFALISGVVSSEGDGLLVSIGTNEIFKYKQTGEYIGSIVLPQMRVYKMYKMNKGNIAFIDLGESAFSNTCIRICDVNGDIINSIGEGVLYNPYSIQIDETSSVLYVANHYLRFFGIGYNILSFDINSGEYINKIDVEDKFEFTLTNERNLLIVTGGNLLTVDKMGYRKVIKPILDPNGFSIRPTAIVMDKDENVIILSINKLYMISSDGKFRKRIDTDKDRLVIPHGLSMISHHPKRVAVANVDCTVKIFQY